MLETLYTNELLYSFLDCIHSGIIAVNKEGIVVVCNAAARKLLASDQEIVGQPIKSLVPESGLLRVINTGQSDFGKRFKLRDKTLLINRTPIIFHGNVIGAVVIFQDTTELDEISTELESYKKVNQELEAIIESSYDGITITDEEGNVTKINRSLLRITGLTENDFIGKNTDFMDGVFTFESVSKVARRDKKILTGLQKIIKTGKEVMVTSTPILGEDGKVSRVVTNVRDMSDIISLQKQLAKSRKISEHLWDQFSKRVAEDLRFHELVSRNPEVYRILDLTRRVAMSDATILLQGESGVGKEVFVKLAHSWSKRKGLLIKVNCGALPASLLESELFGYTRGAFTGASPEGKSGLLERAEGGTLFLDEIEDLPLELQGKFLRVLQDCEFTRVGGTTVIKANVRFVVASNKDLAKMVMAKTFREDLYYRINVVPILIPPLRERPEDIPLLAEFFLSKFNEKYGTNKSIAPHLMDAFNDYDWPGNIRELKNLVERLVLTDPEDIISDVSFFPDGEEKLDSVKSLNLHDLLKLPTAESKTSLLKDAVENVEKDLLQKALLQYKNSRMVGKVLGISHTTVLQKLKKYGIK